ncbi:MAG: hypothetical protein WAN16_08130 [Chthoniobacterales bacterium]
MTILNVKRVERFGWFLVALLIAYWAVYVAVAPVTTSDSHIYNLARLLIAERGGLFHNPLWTNTHQVVFPWGFDAVYYPFLKIGLFENLPAFVCLIGSFLCVAILFRRGGVPGATPLCMLALLSSPLVVFQATCAKNDIAVAFFALSAFTMIELSRDGRSMARDVGIAISLGMLAGAKTSGIVPAAILSLYSLGLRWQLQGKFGALRLAAMILPSMMLLGSMETYLNNYMIYGRATGDPIFINGHRNIDGVQGAVANLVRYFFNSLATGLESRALIRDYRMELWSTCDSLLQMLALHNKGMAPYSSDKIFLLGCHECASTYGIIGLASIPLAVAAVVTSGIRGIAGRLAILGWILFAVACITIGWQKFVMRLILAAALPLIIAAILHASPYFLKHKRLLLCLQIMIFLLAALVPLCSWNRGPISIIHAACNHGTEAVQESKIKSNIEEIKAAVSIVEKESYLMAVILGPDDSALPFLNKRAGRWIIIPNINGKIKLDTEDLKRSLDGKGTGLWLILASGHNRNVSLPKECRIIWEKDQCGKIYLFDSVAEATMR